MFCPLPCESFPLVNSRLLTGCEVRVLTEREDGSLTCKEVSTTGGESPVNTSTHQLLQLFQTFRLLVFIVAFWCVPQQPRENRSAITPSTRHVEITAKLNYSGSWRVMLINAYRSSQGSRWIIDPYWSLKITVVQNNRSLLIFNFICSVLTYKPATS